MGDLDELFLEREIRISDCFGKENGFLRIELEEFFVSTAHIPEIVNSIKHFDPLYFGSPVSGEPLPIHLFPLFARSVDQSFRNACKPDDQLGDLRTEILLQLNHVDFCIFKNVVKKSGRHHLLTGSIKQSNPCRNTGGVMDVGHFVILAELALMRLSGEGGRLQNDVCQLLFSIS